MEPQNRFHLFWGFNIEKIFLIQQGRVVYLINNTSKTDYALRKNKFDTCLSYKNKEKEIMDTSNSVVIGGGEGDG